MQTKVSTSNITTRKRYIDVLWHVKRLEALKHLNVCYISVLVCTE